MKLPKFPKLPKFSSDAVGAFLHALFRSSRGFPFATNLSLVSIPIGLLAMILGPAVSRSFETLYHRPEIIYIWGVVMFLGGINVLIGIGRRKPSIERAGLFVIGPAFVFYGVSVLLALRVGGLVTGPLSTVIGISCVQRANRIAEAARQLLRANAEDKVRALNEVTKL